MMDQPNSLLLTKDCDVILQNCLKRSDLKVVSYSTQSLSDKIEGFLGAHFFVTIEYEDKEGSLKSLRCFMKVLNESSQFIFEISQALDAYSKEEFFYNFALSEFNKYNIDTSFAPRGYFCKPHLLVLEDLSQRNFTCYPNRSMFLDLEHCQAGLVTLAKLHATGLLYEATKSSEEGTCYHLVERFPQMFQEKMFVNDSLAQIWFNKSVEGLFHLIPIVCAKCNVDKEDFLERFSHALRSLENYIDYVSKFKGTILHGDLWYNNFMFKYEEERVTESILLDFQFLKYGPPSVDVLHFMFTNTRKSFRLRHFEDLVEFYYKELNKILSKYDSNVYLPKEQYLQLCKELQFVLKVQCICDRSVTLLVDNSEDVMPSEEEFRLNMFERRTEKIIDCFNKHDFYKEIISEDVLELYDILVESQFNAYSDKF